MAALLRISCLVFLLPLTLGAPQACDVTDKNARFDCLPGPTASQANCEARGCCWDPSNGVGVQGRLGIQSPYCYFPKSYVGYNLSSVEETAYGYKATLARSTSSYWPNDVKQLSLDVWLETSTRLHFRIYDPAIPRFQVPIVTPPVPTTKAPTSDFTVEFSKAPFGLTVHRKSTGLVLFDTTVAPLIFADQFLQLSTVLSTELLYGLGEHKNPLLHNTSSWQRLAFWAKDQSPVPDSNLYGSHPFYLNVEKDGNVHGAFLLNSNAMDVDIQPLPALTFRTIGGILDFYVFTGPSARDVVQQYVEVIGRPQMPPYWALGFHLCRFDYNSVTKLKEVIARNRALDLPYDVQWNDIDYASRQRDWTYDNVSYAGLPAVVKDLHNYTQKYIIIVDPGISNQYAGKYQPYDSGITRGVFVLNSTGGPIIGKVWPGTTVFPDFFNPLARDWWADMAQDFHAVLPFDGLWTDMNEPSNFVTGSTTGCTNGSLDVPPYTPAISGNGKLEYNTLCPSAQHFYSSHYNLHNMYGLSEVIATNAALEKILGKRSIVISRSSFPSLGRFGGHWSGDVISNWVDIYYSIPTMLEFQWYGIPLVGADVCGFAGDTTEELCTRWMQLGAFYPFMRNHNDASSRDQDPGVWSPPAQQAMKSALELRYSLLPYMYTRFYHARVNGTPVVQPLFFQYPLDANTYAIDHQFLWGSDLLISPVLTEGAVNVTAYFPADLWYELDGGLVSSKAQSLVLKAPLDTIPVHIRGGAIVPRQPPAITTTIARTKPFTLLIALNQSLAASGELYWDDGETLESIEKGQFSHVIFEVSKGGLSSTVLRADYQPVGGLILDTVVGLGVPTMPTVVKLNGVSVPYSYNAVLQQLLVFPIQVDLLHTFSLVWQSS